MKIISVVGARPQFVKAAPVCRALRANHEEILVHSGQHYDYEMSDVFFEELGIPKPDFNLAVGSGNHGRQTGEMLALLEELFLEQSPDAVLVYGDTNTTLAAGLAAAKLARPVVHVEAGLRSFNRSMPEELNRVVVDHLSDVLLCPTETSVANLRREGIVRGVHRVGDVMLDAARFFSEHCDPGVATRFGVTPNDFYLATVHRAATSDDPNALKNVIQAFARLDRPVLWALHPRTRKNIDAFGLGGLLDTATSVLTVPPVSYIEMIGLLGQASAILTDSGGMQKEAYFLGVPCVTLREETEWVETVELGWNRLVGSDPDAIASAVSTLERPAERPDVYGDGHAADAIVRVVEDELLGVSACG